MIAGIICSGSSPIVEEVVINKSLFEHCTEHIKTSQRNANSLVIAYCLSGRFHFEII